MGRRYKFLTLSKTKLKKKIGLDIYFKLNS